MPELIITGTPINFPNSSASPSWSAAIIQFAQLVANALSSFVGSFDVVPQQFILDSVPNGVDTAITNLSFSNTEVRSALINYALYRNTSTTTVTESGILNIVYNESAAPGNKWQMTRESDSDAQVNFVVDDTGQLYINTTALGGIMYNGKISYSGKALQNSY